MALQAILLLSKSTSRLGGEIYLVCVTVDRRFETAWTGAVPQRLLCKPITFESEARQRAAANEKGRIQGEQDEKLFTEAHSSMLKMAGELLGEK